MAIILVKKTSKATKVKVVKSFPDLMVYLTDKPVEARGKDEIWLYDDRAVKPDHLIQWVNSFEDLKVQFVKSKSQAGWKNKKHVLMNRIG